MTRVTGGQATVERYDAQLRAGTVLRDDGSRLPFAAAALEGGAVRLLRPGQRVALDVADGEVVAVRPPWVAPPAAGPPPPAAGDVDPRVRARNRGTMGP